MSKTKTKYVNHDGWPELRKRLEKEITLRESFFEPLEEGNDLGTAEDGIALVSHLDSLKPGFRIAFCQVAYRMLFQDYPVIKLKVSEQIFESWLLIHSVDELKTLINYKND